MKPRLSKNKFANYIFLLLLLPLPILLNFFIVSYELTYIKSLPSTVYYTFFMIFSFIFITITFFLQKHISKKVTQKKYVALSNLQSYQKEHYKHIEVQREHLNNFKKDFHKQITNISDLLSNEHKEPALSLLSELTKKVNSTKEYPYCSSPIINAILSGKEHECQLSSIAFSAELNINSCETIPPTHLCSIFTNLLDNAISACQHIDNVSERYIRLTSRQSGDYLHIKVTNASLSPEPPKEGHGYGQKILKDIARKYNGNFQTNFENNIYEAYFSIRLS